MKNLLRILIVATFFGIIFYYTSVTNEETEPLHGPNSSNQAIPKTELVQQESMYPERPNEGLSTYIGKDSEVVIKKYGLPTRIDKSNFGFEWWTYSTDQNYIMFSVMDDKVNQVYTNSSSNNVAPYTLGQTLDDIYRMTIIETEISVTIDENIYIFNMNESDMKNRILVAFDGVFGQLYMDEETGTLVGVRYMDGETLVLQKPYEFQYIGEVIQTTTPSSFDQVGIDQAIANQLNYLVNVFRAKNDLAQLSQSPNLNETATKHSQDMYVKNNLSHESDEFGNLEDRLKANEIDYEKADENLALGYYDAIEAVHGWMNSKDHREVILNNRYNYVGAGVYMNYYTQIFIEKEGMEERNK